MFAYKQDLCQPSFILLYMGWEPPPKERVRGKKSERRKERRKKYKEYTLVMYVGCTGHLMIYDKYLGTTPPSFINHHQDMWSSRGLMVCL